MLRPRVYNTPGLSRFGRSTPSKTHGRSDHGPKIRVVARVRPFLPSETDDAPTQVRSCVSILDGGTAQTLQISDPNNSRQECYVLDRCYSAEDNVYAIFASEVEPILPGLFKGFNATVFAYGATGSGKTHTMQGVEEKPGLMPLALETILDMASDSDSSISVSYYEVYMDRCYDLLEDKAAELSVLESADGRIQLRGLRQVQVTSVEEFREVFRYGCLRRRVGQTGINDASSRSHGILVVTVRTEDERNLQTVGKLNLIDLAGNEDNRRTGNEGVRLAESARINQSLFALSNVINALNSKESRVPYRDSKLTRILQDSLGGTSRALMIACLNPGSYREAAHTLNLAARSRQIVYQQSQQEKTENSQQVDMEVKLQAWLEAKAKRSVASPSPFKVKRAVYPSPSLPLSRLRNEKTERKLPVLKARNIPLDSPQLCLRKQNKANGQELMKREPTNISNTLNQSTDHESLLLSLGTEKHEHKLVAEREERDATNRLTLPFEAEKENASQPLVPFTPCDKVKMSGSLSPPLSETLRNMTSAMKEMLVFSSTLKGDASPKSPSTPQRDGHNISSMPAAINETSSTDDESTETCGTPLEKFSRNSSGIKNSLLKEYLDFLNKASREELLELKGIGQRRASYILSLREASPQPLKELEDLRKIGLSQKQANVIFKDTARQIFS